MTISHEEALRRQRRNETSRRIEKGADPIVDILIERSRARILLRRAITNLGALSPFEGADTKLMREIEEYLEETE